jgi:predicted SnoaL-like aldol condensation-catalyzing enzyme
MKKMLLILALIGFAASTYAQAPVKVVSASAQQHMLKSDNPRLAANKKLVFDFWRKVFQTHDMTTLRHYVSKDYIQHNPNIASGLPPFINYFGQLKRQPVKPTIDRLVSMVAEGDKVVLAFKRVLRVPGHPKQTYTTTWFDMFRIEHGKIVEHWDCGTKPDK